MAQIYIFLDYANITIMAQKCAGRKYKFPDGINDRSIKVIPSKLYDLIQHQNKQTSLEMFYYTTDRSLTTEEIGGRMISGLTFKMSAYDKKEKAVDTHLVADAVEMICQSKHVDPVIQIWSGDADVIKPILAKARKYGSKIEIWSFKASLTENAGNSAEQEVKIKYLDDIFEQFIERKTSWSPQKNGEFPNPSTSFKLRFSRDCPGWEKAMGKDSSLNWRQIVNVLTEKVRVPLKGYVKNDELTLILVLDVPPARMKESLEEIQKEQGKHQEFIRNWFELKYQIHSNCSLEIVGGGAEMQQGFQRLNLNPPTNEGWRQPNQGGRGQGGFRGRPANYRNP